MNLTLQSRQTDSLTISWGEPQDTSFTTFDIDVDPDEGSKAQPAKTNKVWTYTRNGLQSGKMYRFLVFTVSGKSVSTSAYIDEYTSRWTSVCCLTYNIAILRHYMEQHRLKCYNGMHSHNWEPNFNQFPILPQGCLFLNMSVLPLVYSKSAIAKCEDCHFVLSCSFGKWRRMYHYIYIWSNMRVIFLADSVRPH